MTSFTRVGFCQECKDNHRPKSGNLFVALGASGNYHIYVAGSRNTEGYTPHIYIIDKVLDDNEKILDNQDLAFLLKVSFRTLQRYKVNNQLPYFTIGRKTYYRAVDIRAFVRERADSQTYKQFEKANQLDNQP